MAMTLSAVMNLTGNFAAQLQANAKAAQEMAQQAKQAGDIIRNSFSENIGQKISSGLSVARDAFGAAGVASAGFLKQCVDGAAKAQKTNADLAQTIKSTGGAAGLTADEVSKMASEFSKSTTFGAGAIKTGQNMLLTFTNIGKDVFPMATQSMLDMAQKMGGDPVNSSIQLGKALNDPTTGLTALTRVGITFNDQQKEQIKSMQAAGDVAGAQKIMLAELNKEFGGQAQAATKTYDGQMKQLSNTFAGIKGAIGSVLLPYIQIVAEKFNTGLQAVSNFATQNKTLIAVILSATAVFGTLIGGASLFQHILSFFGPTVQAIIGLIGGLSLPIMAVIAAIGLLIAAYTTNFGGIKDFLDGVIGNIVSAFQSATDAFKNTGSAIAAISAFIGNLFGDDAADIAADTLNRIKDIVMSLVETVKAHMPEIKAVFLTVFSAIGTIWSSVLKPVLAFIISTLVEIVRWVSDNWPLISSTIQKVMSFISAIIQATLSVISDFWSAHGQTIMSIVKNAWGIIKTVITTALSVIESIISAVMNIINGNWSAAWNNLCNAVSSIFGGAVSIIQDVLNSIGAIFADIATTAWNWGKDMIEGIVNGIKGAIGDVGNAVTSVADKIKSILHFSVPDEGPLTDYETWMPDFMQGLSNGIKINTHLVTDPIKDLSLGIKTNTLGNLSDGVNKVSNSTTLGSSDCIIKMDKLAEQIVIREDADIDKILDGLVDRLRKERMKLGKTVRM